MPGVVITAPPMPNIPDSTPLTKPRATVRAIWRPTRHDGGGYSQGVRGPVTVTLSPYAE